MRIALLADLHGNWPATQALEQDLKRRAADRIICLGDIVGKGPSSDKTCDWAFANCDAILGGNWDYGIGFRQFGPDEFYWNQLGEERMRKLRELPREMELALSGRRIRLFHGRPVMENLITIRDDAEAIQPFFEDGHGGRYDVVGYADAHRQALRTMSPGLFFNCGSVGNAMGNPLVCYALLEGDDKNPEAALEVRLLSLPYDREQSVRDAQAAVGLRHVDAYINEVRTGVYSRKPGIA